MRYVTEIEFLAIHARIIDAGIGAHGVRDIELLRSIIERPKAAFQGKDMYPTVFEKAACYLDGTARYHVFVDGNKRTAFAIAVFFLEHNGYMFSAGEDEVVQFMVGAVVEHFDLQKIAGWLQENAQERE